MKKLNFVFIAFFVFSIQLSNGQKDTLRIEEIYKDYSTFLVSEVIFQFDSISTNELIDRFESWGGQNFREYETVRTSKTSTQITLAYISPIEVGIYKMYLKMIVEFKDNKIRIRIYDSGNVETSGSYYGTTHIAGKSAGTSHLIDNFEHNMIIYNPQKKAFNVKEMHASGSIAYKNEIESTLISIEKFITDYSNNLEKQKSSW